MGRGESVQRILLLLCVSILLLFTVVPLSFLFVKAFQNRKGQFTGLDNFKVYFASPTFLDSLEHTMFISITATVIAVVLAFWFAYGLTRSNMRGKGLLKGIALIPLFSPTMMHGIVLIYLLGNQGMLTALGLQVHLYGVVGIVISEVIYSFPQALLILLVAFSLSDYRLYEASETLGGSKIRTFFNVTIPNVKYGLISASFVCFTLSFTDFGAPSVVGGNYNVLATDIYKQVIGQQNMEMGAMVGIFLLIPAVLAFIVDQLIVQKQGDMASSKAVPFQIKPSRNRDLFYTVYCGVIGLTMLLFLGTAMMASLVKVWPYDFSLSLIHYDFGKAAGGGMEVVGNSIVISLITAVLGTVFTFMIAYLIEKTRTLTILRKVSYLAAILPLALPGLVIGLAYIFFFNRLSFPIPFTNLYVENSLNDLYGTIWIVVIANMIHFFSVPFITATTALKKLDREYEYVSESMKVPFYKTLVRVTIPMSLPALLENVIYFFVNSMVTISAVVFLYAPDFKLAAISITNMDDAGNIASASAMCVIILFINMGVRFGYERLTKGMKKRVMKWQEREAA